MTFAVLEFTGHVVSKDRQWYACLTEFRDRRVPLRRGNAIIPNMAMIMMMTTTSSISVKPSFLHILPPGSQQNVRFKMAAAEKTPRKGSTQLFLVTMFSLTLYSFNQRFLAAVEDSRRRIDSAAPV